MKVNTLSAMAVILCSLAAPAAAQDGDAGTGLIDVPALDFDAVDLDGHAVRLSDLAGKVVLINFWGVWCTSRPNVLCMTRRFPNTSSCLMGSG